jgi:hypothetical protein
MPISKHFGGHGIKVLKAMKQQYGEEKAERVFYATDNARKNKKDSRVKKAFRRGMKKS